MPTRRAALGGLAALLTPLAGCSSVTGTDVQNTPEGEELLNRSVTIEANDFWGWEFSPGTAATLEYEFHVTEGPHIDMFVMKSSEYERFRSGGKFLVRDMRTGLGGWESIELSGDTDWAIVLDNTDEGHLTPPPPDHIRDEVAEVTIEARLLTA